MYYWLFNTEDATPVLNTDFEDMRLFQSGKSIASQNPGEIKVYFDSDSFQSNDITGEYFLTDYFPLASSRFVDLLKKNNITDYELFDVRLLARDGSESKREFHILNLTANCKLKSMKEHDPNCSCFIFRNSESFEYVTISDDFLQMLKEAEGNRPWHVYTSSRYDFEWFKKNHFELLSEIFDELSDCYEDAPLGKPFDRQRTAQYLKIIEKLTPYSQYLPNSGSGLPNFKKLKAQAEEFKERFLDKPEDSASYWLAQEIKMTVSSIHNYMDTMCFE